MDEYILARTMQRLRSGAPHMQGVSRREFKGCPFNSKPKVIHFKVSHGPGSWSGGHSNTVLTRYQGDPAPLLGGSDTSPGGLRHPSKGMWLLGVLGSEGEGGRG